MNQADDAVVRRSIVVDRSIDSVFVALVAAPVGSSNDSTKVTISHISEAIPVRPDHLLA